MPLLDYVNQISKYTMCTCCGKSAGLFSHILFDIERVVPIAINRRKFIVSKLKSPSRLSTNYRNTAFLILEAGTRVADGHAVFGAMNKQFVVCRHVSASMALKMTSLSQAGHG